MKCILCNDRNGSARCEGCQQLYCVPCINKHRENLSQQFQQTVNARNELNQSLTVVESTIKTDKTISSIIKINDWERKTIDRIRDIAARARTSVHEILAESMVEVRRRFDQLSADVQRWQKEGNYLEMDIDSLKNRLKQLKKDIECGTKKVHVDTTTSENISWDTLIYVTIEDLSNEETFKRTQANNCSKVGESKSIFSNERAKSGETSTISTRPTLSERVVTEQQSQKLIETPVLMRRSDVLLNSSVVNRQRGENRLCIICNQSSDLLSTGICSACNYYNIRTSNLTTSVSSVPRTNSPPRLACSHCKSVNALPNTENGGKYYCSVCEATLSIRYGEE